MAKDKVQNGHQVFTFDQLVELGKPEAEYIELKGYGGGVRARPLTMSESMRLNKDNTRGSGKKAWLDTEGLSKDMIVTSLIEPELTREQVDVLFLQKVGLAGALVQALNKLNGFGAEQEEAEAEAEAEFREE